MKVNTNTIDIKKAEFQLQDFCDRVKNRLNGLSLHDKRYALDALDVRVVATENRIEIKAIVPLEFTNTKQGFIYSYSTTKRST